MTCFASISMTKVCTYIIINPVFYGYLKYLDKPVMLHMLLFQLPSWPDLQKDVNNNKNEFKKVRKKVKRTAYVNRQQ